MTSSRANQTDTLAAALAEAAKTAGLGASSEVVGLKRLSGGASMETWSFDLEGDGAALPCILRRAPEQMRFSSQGKPGVRSEAAILQATEAAGVRVPKVHFVASENSPLGDGYVMSRIDGETLGARIVKDPAFEAARENLAFECGAELARIHATPLEAAPDDLARSTPAQAVANLRSTFASTGQKRPVFEWAFNWLADNAPPDDRMTLVHGDFRNGNIIIDPVGLRAVLDWEGAHIGHPMEDLGWLCVNSWRFGRWDLPVGGFGTRDQLVAGYRSVSDMAVSEDDFHFWEVLGTIKWGVITSTAGHSFSKGARNVEAAMIARRTSETEFDLLTLLAPQQETGHA